MTVTTRATTAPSGLAAVVAAAITSGVRRGVVTVIPSLPPDSCDRLPSFRNRLAMIGPGISLRLGRRAAAEAAAEAVAPGDVASTARVLP